MTRELIDRNPIKNWTYFYLYLWTYELVEANPTNHAFMERASTVNGFVLVVAKCIAGMTMSW